MISVKDCRRSKYSKSKKQGQNTVRRRHSRSHWWYCGDREVHHFKKIFVNHKLKNETMELFPDQEDIQEASLLLKESGFDNDFKQRKQAVKSLLHKLLEEYPELKPSQEDYSRPDERFSIKVKLLQESPNFVYYANQSDHQEEFYFSKDNSILLDDMNIGPNMKPASTISDLKHERVLPVDRRTRIMNAMQGKWKTNQNKTYIIKGRNIYLRIHSTEHNKEYSETLAGFLESTYKPKDGISISWKNRPTNLILTSYGIHLVWTQYTCKYNREKGKREYKIFGEPEYWSGGVYNRPESIDFSVNYKDVEKEIEEENPSTCILEIAIYIKEGIKAKKEVEYINEKK